MEVSKREYDLLISHVLATESQVQGLRAEVERLDESRNKWVDRCLEITEHIERSVYEQGERLREVESGLEESMFAMSSLRTSVSTIRKFYVPKSSVGSHWWQFWK